MWYKEIWSESSETNLIVWFVPTEDGWVRFQRHSLDDPTFVPVLKFLRSDKHISDPKLKGKQKKGDNCTKWQDTDTKAQQQDRGPGQALDQVGGSLSSDCESWIRQLEFHICRSSNYLTAASEELPWRAVWLSLRRVAFREWQSAPSALYLKPHRTAGLWQISTSAKTRRELFQSLQKNANAAKANHRSII